MAAIKRLLAVLSQQEYAIQELVVSPEISHSLKPTTVFKIVTSYHPSPNIIKNEKWIHHTSAQSDATSI